MKSNKKNGTQKWNENWAFHENGPEGPIFMKSPIFDSIFDSFLIKKWIGKWNENWPKILTVSIPIVIILIILTFSLSCHCCVIVVVCHCHVVHCPHCCPSSLLSIVVSCCCCHPFLCGVVDPSCCCCALSSILLSLALLMSAVVVVVVGLVATIYIMYSRQLPWGILISYYKWNEINFISFTAKISFLISFLHSVYFIFSKFYFIHSQHLFPSPTEFVSFTCDMYLILPWHLFHL